MSGFAGLWIGLGLWLCGGEIGWAIKYAVVQLIEHWTLTEGRERERGT